MIIVRKFGTRSVIAADEATGCAFLSTSERDTACNVQNARMQLEYLLKFTTQSRSRRCPTSPG